MSLYHGGLLVLAMLGFFQTSPACADAQYPIVTKSTVVFSPSLSIQLARWSREAGGPVPAGTPEDPALLSVIDSAQVVGPPRSILVTREETYETSSVFFVTVYSMDGSAIFKRGPFGGSLLVSAAMPGVIVAEVTGEDDAPSLTWLTLHGRVAKQLRLPGSAFSAKLSDDGLLVLVKSDVSTPRKTLHRLDVVNLQGTIVAKLTGVPESLEGRVLAAEAGSIAFAMGD